VRRPTDSLPDKTTLLRLTERHLNTAREAALACPELDAALWAVDGDDVAVVRDALEPLDLPHYVLASLGVQLLWHGAQRRTEGAAHDQGEDQGLSLLVEALLRRLRERPDFRWDSLVSTELMSIWCDAVVDVMPLDLVHEVLARGNSTSLVTTLCRQALRHDHLEAATWLARRIPAEARQSAAQALAEIGLWLARKHDLPAADGFFVAARDKALAQPATAEGGDEADALGELVTCMSRIVEPDHPLLVEAVDALYELGKTYVRDDLRSPGVGRAANALAQTYQETQERQWLVHARRLSSVVWDQALRVRVRSTIIGKAPDLEPAPVPVQADLESLRAAEPRQLAELEPDHAVWSWVSDLEQLEPKLLLTLARTAPFSLVSRLLTHIPEIPKPAERTLVATLLFARLCHENGPPGPLHDALRMTLAAAKLPARLPPQAAEQGAAEPLLRLMESEEIEALSAELEAPANLALALGHARSATARHSLLAALLRNPAVLTRGRVDPTYGELASASAESSTEKEAAAESRSHEGLAAARVLGKLIAFADASQRHTLLDEVSDFVRSLPIKEAQRYIVIGEVLATLGREVPEWSAGQVEEWWAEFCRSDGAQLIAPAVLRSFLVSRTVEALPGDLLAVVRPSVPYVLAGLGRLGEALDQVGSLSPLFARVEFLCSLGARIAARAGSEAPALLLRCLDALQALPLERLNKEQREQARIHTLRLYVDLGDLEKAFVLVDAVKICRQPGYSPADTARWVARKLAAPTESQLLALARMVSRSLPKDLLPAAFSLLPRWAAMHPVLVPAFVELIEAQAHKFKADGDQAALHLAVSLVQLESGPSTAEAHWRRGVAGLKLAQSSQHLDLVDVLDAVLASSRPDSHHLDDLLGLLGHLELRKANHALREFTARLASGPWHAHLLGHLGSPTLSPKTAHVGVRAWLDASASLAPQLAATRILASFDVLAHDLELAELRCRALSAALLRDLESAETGRAIRAQLNSL